MVNRRKVDAGSDRRSGRTQRQPKQSREALRSLLLETGRTILIEEGLGTRADTLTFKRVFDRVESDSGLRLSNASIIRRVWENQADYQADVLAVIAAEEGLGAFDRTIQALLPLVENLDVSTPEARRRSLREVCRVGGAANILTLLESPNWSLWVAVWSLATSEPPRSTSRPADYHKRIRVALLEGYDGFTGLWEEAYRALAGLVGMRIRAPLTFAQLSVAVGALAEGSSLRHRVDERMEGILLPTGPDGAEQEWTLFAIGLEALLDRFLEPDPDWTPPDPGPSAGGPAGGGPASGGPASGGPASVRTPAEARPERRPADPGAPAD